MGKTKKNKLRVDKNDKFKLMEVDNYDNYDNNNNKMEIIFYRKFYEVYKKYE